MREEKGVIERYEEEKHREAHAQEARGLRLAAENIELLIERVEILEGGWRRRVVELVVYGVLGLFVGLSLAGLVG